MAEDCEQWWQALWATGSEEPQLTCILVDRNGPDYHPHDPDLNIYAPTGFDLGGADGAPHAVVVLSRDRGKALAVITRVLGGYGVDTSGWGTDVGGDV